MLKTQSNYSVNELLRFLIRIKYIGQWFLLTYTIVDYGAQSVILTLNVAYGVPQTYSKNSNTG